MGSGVVLLFIKDAMKTFVLILLFVLGGVMGYGQYEGGRMFNHNYWDQVPPGYTDTLIYYYDYKLGIDKAEHYTTSHTDFINLTKLNLVNITYDEFGEHDLDYIMYDGDSTIHRSKIIAILKNDDTLTHEGNIYVIANSINNRIIKYDKNKYLLSEGYNPSGNNWGLKLSFIEYDQDSLKIVSQQSLLNNTHPIPFLYFSDGLKMLTYNLKSNDITSYYLANMKMEEMWSYKPFNRQSNNIIDEEVFDYYRIGSGMFNAFFWYVNSDRADRILICDIYNYISDSTDQNFKLTNTYELASISESGVKSASIFQTTDNTYFAFTSPDMRYAYGVSNHKSDTVNIVKYDLIWQDRVKNSPLYDKISIQSTRSLGIWMNKFYYIPYTYLGDKWVKLSYKLENLNSTDENYIIKTADYMGWGWYFAYPLPQPNLGPIDIHQHRFVDMCAEDLPDLGLNEEGTRYHLDGISYEWRLGQLYDAGDSVAAIVNQYLEGVKNEKNPQLPPIADSLWSGRYMCKVTKPVGDSTFTWDRVVFVRVMHPIKPELRVGGKPGPLCPGEERWLLLDNYSELLTCDWSNGAQNTESITVSEEGWYGVTLRTPYGCEYTDSVWVEYDDMVLEIEGPSKICEGDMAELAATEGFASYKWNTGDTTRTIEAGEEGAYWVEAMSQAGCLHREQIYLSVSRFLDVEIRATDTILCDGETAKLYVGSYYKEMEWGDGSMGDTLYVDRPGSYTLRAVSLTGCEGFDTIVIRAGEMPQPQISGGGTYCEGGSATLTASGGDTYLWNTGETSESIEVSVDGVYSVTAFSADECEATASAEVAFSEGLLATIEGPEWLCEGNTAVLTAGPEGMEYLWSTGETGRSIEVTDAGEYEVTVRDEKGCEGSASHRLELLEGGLTAEEENIDLGEVEYGEGLMARYRISNGTQAEMELSDGRVLQAGEEAWVTLEDLPTESLGVRDTTVIISGRAGECDFTSTTTLSYYVYGRVELALEADRTEIGGEQRVALSGRTLSRGLTARTGWTATLPDDTPVFFGQGDETLTGDDELTPTRKQLGTYEGILLLYPAGDYVLGFEDAELTNPDLRLETVPATVTVDSTCESELRIMTPVGETEVSLAGNVLEVRRERSDAAFLTVWDMQGRELLREAKEVRGTASFDLGGLATGVYAMELRTGGRVIRGVVRLGV